MIMDRLYGGVCYAGIDTDPELKYPKGAGRVAFSNQQSYIAAISARFVQLQHNDIDKRVSGFTHFIHNIRPLKEKAASPPQLRFSQSCLMARCRAELCLSPLPCIGAFITAQPTVNGRPGPAVQSLRPLAAGVPTDVSSCRHILYGCFNYSSSLIHVYPLGLCCSRAILGTPANCSGTDRDQERLGVSQGAEPL